MFDWFRKKKPAEPAKTEEAKAPEVVPDATPAAVPETVSDSDSAIPPSTVIPAEAGTQEPQAPTPPPAPADVDPDVDPLTLAPGLRRDDREEDGEPTPEVTPEQAGFAAEPEQVSPLPAALEADAIPELEDKPEKKSWFSRLKDGLSKSTSRLTEGITGIFTKKKLDDEALEELEELLIRADLGPTTAARLTAGLAKTRFGKEVSPQEVREYLAGEVQKIVEPVAKPLTIDPARKPHVVLVVGVNGTGKTTTIGKLARQLRAEGKTVWMAAGDTFRAAAVSQLKIWGERTGCPVVARDTGADAAGLAFDAFQQAKAAGADVLLIDTAGRLQNKAGLMDELRKVVRVIKKLDPDAPHTTLLTLDATTGQNAHSQVEVFKDMVAINGLVLTKLDGSARGGVLVALAEKFKLPVHFIGVGEGVYDLRPFEAKAFARALVGLE
ncbi:signal recognition particle-docking protein FtsY [Aerophototrophica crusticola]|uniref:Signal recognition particle receptor FtsY n=2 Tax=Aerophototrophica crusticola TaxID=1709002 RepID=A0A858R8U0_9PROT|nr:signal recognition particle-docking protein FtsY [Rhodospirillaceae bacterium B3]